MGSGDLGLTHWDRKQTDEDLDARNPHEALVGTGSNEPIVRAPCEAEGEKVLSANQLW